MFDLDGTLWEVIDATYKGVKKATDKYNLKEVSREVICAAFGTAKPETFKMYFPDMSAANISIMDEISEFINEYLEIYGGNIYKNVYETIKLLSNEYSLFIISNTAYDKYIFSFVNSSRLGKYFSGYIAASKYQITKAEAIRNLIEKYNFDDAVYVGDTMIDYEESKKANVKFIHAKYGFGKDVKSEYYINDIIELPNVVKNIM